MKTLKNNFKKWLDKGDGDEWLANNLSNGQVLEILIKTFIVSIFIISFLNLLHGRFN